MYPLVIKHDKRDESFPEDVTRIKRVVLQHGYCCRRADAMALWEIASDRVCAGWLILPKDDETLWRMVKDYIMLEEEDED